MNLKIATYSNFGAALILLFMGFLYLFTDSFMPYHSKAVSLEWTDVGYEMQKLILALMRAVAGGFIASAIAIIVLQLKFNKLNQSWLPILIFIIGTIVSLSSIYATLIIRIYTPGDAPTFLALIGLLILVVGFIFNRASIKNR